VCCVAYLYPCFPWRSWGAYACLIKMLNILLWLSFFMPFCSYINSLICLNLYRLCILVARVSGYRSRDPGFHSRPYQIFWYVGVSNWVHSVSWGQLRSYLNEKVAAPVYKTEIKGRGKSLRSPRNTLYLQKSALTSPTSGGRSAGIVRLRTTTTESSFSLNF
jgi:hypothetical protein